MNYLPLVACAVLALSACSTRHLKPTAPPPHEQPTADWIRDSDVILMDHHAHLNPYDYSLPASKKIQGLESKVRRCYWKELKENPRLYGQMVIAVEIAQSGDVIDTHIKFSTVPSLGIESCLTGHIKGLHFEKHDEETPVRVNYAYVFTSGATPMEITGALVRLHRLYDPEERNRQFESQGSEEAPW